jgi:hypothetical protein
VTPVTEDQWNECTDPTPILEFLRNSGRFSGRKLRLFACACCRSLWHLLSKEYRHAVEIAEQFADLLAGASELASCSAEAFRAAMWGSTGPIGPLWEAGWFTDPYGGALAVAQDPDAPAALVHAATMENAHDIPGLCLPWAAALGLEPAVQVSFLRDVNHAPYRATFMRATWLTWNGGTIKRLAEAAYQERALPWGTLDNLRIAVLADALEEAGCQDQDIFRHCREQGVHVRGCWVLDLLLGKQ